MPATLRKSDAVTYPVRGSAIRARVTRVHRDGTVTVEAQFYLDANGKEVPGYLGFKYRVPADMLAPLPAAA